MENQLKALEDCTLVFGVLGIPEMRSLQGARCKVRVGGKKKNPMVYVPIRLADRFRSPWKQTSEETMEREFRLSHFPIFSLNLLDRHNVRHVP
jgi:hypothetical protein